MPVLEMLPGPGGTTVQSTEVFEVPVTVATNLCCCPAASGGGFKGLTLIETGMSVIRAVATFVLSATLVTVTVAICGAEIDAGAI